MKTRKTAGTSIEMLLEPFCAPPGHKVTEFSRGLVTEYGVIGHRLMQRNNIPSSELTVWRGHLPSWQARKELGPRKWRKYFRFTSVRNPFDRAVSFYHWRCDVDGETVPTSMPALRESFRDALLADKTRDDFSVVHWRGKYQMHDAIRYENLNSDLARICKKLGLSVNLDQLGHAKSKTSRPKKKYQLADYFDTETIDYVRNQMAWVFEHFDYPDTPGAWDDYLANESAS